ncbi:MAG: antibiotic biosynthesis monooxygenase [Actinomycetota bacterium]|nr:antibiotic biosynthesis monooxygenase [Actinomycetota bacterium]MDQ6944993.1 antibiotic biosynthesis monooxygenase [Actinomycetota bacterium]
MEIVLFKIRPRVGRDDAEYERTFEQMYALVSAIPGFIGIDGYQGEDGSELAVARFESREAIAEWRDQPEHVRTQQRGRDEFFAGYEITIGTVWREYSWPERSAHQFAAQPPAAAP